MNEETEAKTLVIHVERVSGSRGDRQPRKLPKTLARCRPAIPVAPTAQLAEGLALKCRRPGVRIPGWVGLGVSPLQVSGGISALQSRASGLQRTTQGIPSGPKTDSFESPPKKCCRPVIADAYTIADFGQRPAVPAASSGTLGGCFDGHFPIKIKQCGGFYVAGGN